jgi:hypothetical protein
MQQPAPRPQSEAGIALIAVLLALVLLSGIMVGMFAAVTTANESNAIDRDQSQTYAAAHAGLEKLTADLAQLFSFDASPNAAQVNALEAFPPNVPAFEFTAPGGPTGSGYDITFLDADNNGNPDPLPNADITAGPFQGFKGFITPFTMTVTARSTTGRSEVRLRRELQTVALPVFQFGIFGERSLAFHAGDNFDFGGRVHTNEHLFLASGGSRTLLFTDRITVVGQVVRQELPNGFPIASSGHTGTVRIATVIGSSYRNLAATEGSVVAGTTSALWPGWENLSKATYNLNIRNTLTGAKRLDLPLVADGAAPIDLIRRPVVDSDEDTANEPVFRQRYFSMASLRILLSDRATDLTGLPTITAGAPVALDGDWLTAPPAGYTAGMPLARSIGPHATFTTQVGSTVAGGVHQIRVGAIPSWMLPVNLSGNGSPVTCTARTPTSFTGCTLTAAVNTNQLITATVMGVTVQAAHTGPNQAAGGGRTLTPNGGTLQFVSDFAWFETEGNGIRPMTCEGYDTTFNPDRLTNCRIAGVTTAQNDAGLEIRTHALSPAETSLIGGFIKIEKQDINGVWTDVTMEILNLGFAARNQEGSPCPDPTPDAVIRIQRLRDNGGSSGSNTCGYASGALLDDSRNYWPNVLFDPREAQNRTLATNAPMRMGGVINYVALDMGNLKRWLAGTIGTTGTQARNNNGYIVYFSDRRANHNDAEPGQPETGEYGHEDSINTAAGSGSEAPNNLLEDGEDRNENGTLETYGEEPSALALYGASAPFDASARPWLNLAFHPEARVNRQVLFRRALKVTNGCIGVGGTTQGCNAPNGVNNLPVDGVTVVAENGVYVEGNYNATSTNVTGASVPAAIIGDAITILSNNWRDVNSFYSPNDMNGRVAVSTGYRFAMISGSSIPFPKPGWAALSNWGSSGGVHNFMRMLEDWGGLDVRYRGSMVSLYTSRQMLGIFKDHDNIYQFPARIFSFDTNFLQPQLLPPGTPMFRDINTLTFRQILRPTQ